MLLQVTRIVLPGMKTRKRSAIVNIGSAAATIAPSGPLYAVYAGTKVSHDCTFTTIAHCSLVARIFDIVVTSSTKATLHSLHASKRCRRQNMDHHPVCSAATRLTSSASRRGRWLRVLGALLLQAYVDMFSKSLNLEYAAQGISVQNQAPMYVATKMSKIRRPTLDAPSPARWVASAIRHIGYEATSCPYWCLMFPPSAFHALSHSHTLQSALSPHTLSMTHPHAPHFVSGAHSLSMTRSNHAQFLHHMCPMMMNWGCRPLARIS